MNWLIALLALVGATPPTHVPSHSCDILRAQYEAPGLPRYHLRFVRLASSKDVISDVGLHIYSDSPQAELSYYLDAGSAPRISLISTTNPTLAGWHAAPDGGVRPHGWATLVAMNSDETIAVDVPSSRSAPPRYIIVPELAEVYKNTSVRYWPAAFVLKRCVS